MMNDEASKEQAQTFKHTKFTRRGKLIKIKARVEARRDFAAGPRSGG